MVRVNSNNLSSNKLDHSTNTSKNPNLRSTHESKQRIESKSPIKDILVNKGPTVNENHHLKHSKVLEKQSNNVEKPKRTL